MNGSFVLRVPLKWNGFTFPLLKKARRKKNKLDVKFIKSAVTFSLSERFFCSSNAVNESGEIVFFLYNKNNSKNKTENEQIRY